MSKIYRNITVSSLKRLVRVNEETEHEVTVEFLAKLKGDPDHHIWRISIFKDSCSSSGMVATIINPWFHPEWNDPSDYFLYESPGTEDIDFSSVNPEQGFWYSREC